MATSTKISEKAAQQFEEDVRAAGLDAPWFHPGPLIQPEEVSGPIGPLEMEQDRAPGAGTPDFVDPGKGAERRILRIANPGVAELTATHTMFDRISVSGRRRRSLRPTVIAPTRCAS